MPTQLHEMGPAPALKGAVGLNEMAPFSLLTWGTRALGCELVLVERVPGAFLSETDSEMWRKYSSFYIRGNIYCGLQWKICIHFNDSTSV